MAKRFIVATFANGHTLTRTTQNTDLAWAWKATWINKHTLKPGVASGFSSRRDLAEKAASVGNGKYITDLKYEVVPAVEVVKPVKAKPNKGYRVQRTWNTDAVTGFRFIKDGKSHKRFSTLHKAEEFITAMKDAGCPAHYKIV